MLRWQQEMPRPGKAVAAAVDNFDLSELSEAAARIENAISWNDTDPQIVEHDDDDERRWLVRWWLLWWVVWYCIHSWYSSWTVWWQSGKTQMRPHLKCMLRQVAVFKKHWLVSRVPEAIFLLLVLVLLMAWLSHPLIELRKVENRQAWVHLAFCQNHRTHVSSPTDAGATRGGPHHAPRLRPDQCMSTSGTSCFRMSQQMETDCFFTWKKCIWYACSGLCSVRFSVLWCHGRRNRTRSRRGGHLCCVFNCWRVCHSDLSWPDLTWPGLAWPGLVRGGDEDWGRWWCWWWVGGMEGEGVGGGERGWWRVGVGERLVGRGWWWCGVWVGECVGVGRDYRGGGVFRGTCWTFCHFGSFWMFLVLSF